MLTAGNVVTAARDRHAAFDQKRNPDPVVLRFLSAYARELHAKVVAIDPSAVRAEASVNLPLASHDAGITLPAGATVVEVVAADPSTVVNPRTYPVELIDATQRLAMNAPLSAAWQIGGVLYLRSPGTVWRNMGSIAYAYTAPIAQLVNLSSVLALPDAAERALTEACASFMAGRGHMDKGLPPIDTGKFAGDHARAEASYLDTVRQRLVGTSFFTRDVIGGFR